jgi:hypothetical protein
MMNDHLMTAEEAEAFSRLVNGEHIGQFFAFMHLPQNLQIVSRPFAMLAASVFIALPRNPERTVALRKLLEAKDAAVRAMLAKDIHVTVTAVN